MQWEQAFELFVIQTFIKICTYVCIQLYWLLISCCVCVYEMCSLLFLHIARDGSGRSGVFMVAYSQLEKLKVEGMVDIFQCVRTMRSQRPGIVADVVRATRGCILFSNALVHFCCS